MIPRKAGLLILSLLGVVGCMTKETGVYDEKIPFETGRATVREVIARWGNPDSVKGSTAIWKAVTSKGGKIKAGYMMIGLTVSSQRIATREYRLTFNDQGVLTDSQIVNSIPDGSTWTILPW